jgi:hypothetical protein
MHNFSEYVIESFNLNEVEKKKVARWANRHWKSCGGPGHNLTYSFSPTEIGTTVTVRCPACKKEYDATDYDCW